MKSRDWKCIAELVGISAIIASLIFVGLELSQSRDAVLSETSASHLSTRVELNNFIGEHPEIWVKGNSGSSLSDADYSVYYKIIESTHWRFWNSWRHSLRFDVDIPRELTVADFAGFLHRNPGALETWKKYIEHRETARKLLVSNYDENRFNSAVFADLARLDQAAN